MKPSKNPRAWISWSVMTMAVAIVTAASCTGKSPTGLDLGTIDSPEELAQLMGATSLPMARVFTLFNVGSGAAAMINDGTPTLSAGTTDRSSTADLTSPVSCPSGGSASYTAVGTTQVTFTNCNPGGVRFSGVRYGWLQSTNATDNMAAIEGGSLTMSGAATGTLSILSGLIQWSVPVTDASTYWQFRATVNGAPVCVWSGGGACPLQ